MAPPTASTPPAGRILILTPRDVETPKDGGALRVSAVRESLRARGYAVDVLAVEGSPSNPVRRGRAAPWSQSLVYGFRIAIPMVLTGSGYLRRFFAVRVVRDLLRLRSGGDYAATVIEYSYLAPYAIAAPTPIVIDLHNIESELKQNLARSITGRGPGATGARWRAIRDARALRLIERGIPAEGWPVATVSDHDRAALQAMASGATSGPVVVAPNGAADAAFAFEAARTQTAVFVAHLGWRPNVDAALWLARSVWPRVRSAVPEAELGLVGRTPDREVLALQDERLGVRVHADVPDVLPYVGTAKVATAPLLAAGGTRLKILEALAAGTPVVATRLGALGLERLAGESLSIVDDPEGFARAIIDRLRAEPAERSRARALVEDYRWQRALVPLVDAVESMLEPR